MNANPTPRSLLIVDDDELFGDSLRIALTDGNTFVSSATSLSVARLMLKSRSFDAVLLDNNLPDGNGIDLIPEILGQSDRTKIILATAFPAFDHAVKAVKQGAYDYISKPIDLAQLQAMVERSFEASRLQVLEQVARYEQDRSRKETSLVGFDSRWPVRSLIERAAATRAPVLITGETGTGKNVIAKAIHFLANDATRPMININCAAIPETLIEAELFGAEKGSYTGATQARKGIFELADQGTLFLDEIGEMPTNLQVKLLTALEDKRIRRVGGDKDRAVDVRIIGATNAEPEKAISEGRFRKDLFYRMSVIRIHLPPLRERQEDIPALCEFFLRSFAPGRRVSLGSGETERLQAYSFPGNVRELRNVIERALLLQEGSEIFPSRLIEAETILEKPCISQASPSQPVHQLTELPLSLSEIEKRHILATLDRCGGNLARTARALDISLSTTKRKLRSFGAIPAQYELAATGSF